MNKADLLQLRSASDQTVGQVRDHAPKVLEILRDLAFHDVVEGVLGGFASTPKLKAQIAKLKLADGDRIPLDQLAAQILKRIKERAAKPENEIAPTQVDAIADRLDELDDQGVFDNPLADNDVLLSDLPLIQDELEEAKIWVVGGIAKVADAQIEKVLAEAPSVLALDDELFEGLISANGLTAAQAKELGLVNSLFLLFDEDPALTAAARAEKYGPEPGRPLASVRDLTPIDAKEWQSLLERWKFPTPGGGDRAAYAGLLARRLALLYPTDAFVRRLPVPDSNRIAQAIANLSPLLGKGVPVVGQPFGSPATDGLNAAGVEQARSAHQLLSRIARAYAKFHLVEVIEDTSIAPEERTKIVSRRISLLRAVLAKHPDLELLYLDYSPDSPDRAALDLDSMRILPDEQRMLVACLKAYQRAHHLTGGVEDAHALHQAGLSSATEAGILSFDEFKAATGFDDATARRHHAKARTTLGRTSSMAAAVVHLVSGGFDKLRVSNVGPDAKEMLRRFEGFEDLFGSQTYCKCSECRSIFSPAAYFVDLLTFVRDSIKPSFKNKDPDHRLRLKVRRPDLWQLPLTCKNTTTLVPALAIANDVLENYVAKYEAARSNETIDIEDRRAVHRLVYLETFARRAATFGQPFVLPLARVTQYLHHFKQRRADIARALGAARDDLTRAELGMSVVARHALLNPDQRLVALARLYDIAFELATKPPGEAEPEAQPGDKLAPVDVSDLLVAMSVTRAELAAIVSARFVQAGAGRPEVISDKQDKASVQNDRERVRRLTPDTLDRIHRFTRLWRLTSWSVSQLDLVLSELGASELSAATLNQIAMVCQAQRMLGSSVTETCALFSGIPSFPTDPESSSLVDQLFNDNAKPGAVRLPDATQSFLHPALRLDSSSSKPDPLLPRLLGGLRVSDQELLALVSNDLHVPLGADPEAASEAARTFALSAENLALLYRHARLAERLDLSLSALFQLLDIVPRKGGRTLDAVEDLDDLTHLLDFYAWFRASNYTLDDAGVILGKTVLQPDAYPNAVAVAASILSGPASGSGLSFADTVFATISGATEDDSKALVEALVAGGTLESAEADNYRLVPSYDPSTPLTLPAEIQVSEAALRDVLAKYHATSIVPARLSSALQIPADKLDRLIAITGHSLVGTPLSNALRVVVPPGNGNALPDEAAALVELVRALLPLTVLFKHRAFDAASLDFVRANAGIFGLDALPAADIGAMHALSVYARFAPPVTDVTFVDDPEPVEATALERALLGFAPETGFAPGVSGDLARILDTNPRTVGSLCEHTKLTGPAALALEQLARAARIAKQLGLGGQALAHVVADAGTEGELEDRAAREYDALDHAADALRAAIRARYPDENEQEKQLEPHENRLRSLRRDALTDYLMHVFHPSFKTRRAISEYFLIDVELEGCARTSRVVSATNSVQLYFQRCLLDLEQDREGNLGDDDPKHVHVRIDKQAIDEWGWRKQYRLWEANRKIFLYPENYLDPDLRDDQTPLFRALSSELFQKEIDHQAALDAYTNYVDGFNEVGTLVIAGAYYDSKTETLHLLGVTRSDPPTYYYRAIENPFAQKRNDEPLYHPWRQISVQIPVRKASPVVYQKRLYVFWLEIRTQSINDIFNAKSMFAGYKHKLTLKFSSLRLDGKWTPPQEIELPEMRSGENLRGVVSDRFPKPILRMWDKLQSLADLDSDFVALLKRIEHDTVWARLGRVQWTKNPKEDYTLEGPNWDTVYPEVSDSGLKLVFRNFRFVAKIDLFGRKAHSLTPRNAMRRIARPNPKRFLLSVHQPDDGGPNQLFCGSPPQWYAGRNAFANLVLENERIDACDIEYGGTNDLKIERYLHHRKNRLANLSSVTGLLAIPGAFENLILQAGRDVLLVERRRHHGARYQLERLGTTLTGKLSRRLFAAGVHGLLDLKFQQSLEEAEAPFSNPHRLRDSTNSRELDFTGPYGVYYRELFFHIPFIIAHHLNSRGQYSAARRWLHYLFDPTAEGKGTDRVWRYREFREQTWQSLRKTLNDERAVQAYESDPFNPHAIARLRLSAYAKSAVMKYLDNLIAWGDHLFHKFTMESVNEAAALYTMASDILGERPQEIGDCGEVDDDLTYSKIQQSLGSGSPFLAELETHATGSHRTTVAQKLTLVAKYALDPDDIQRVLVATPVATDDAELPDPPEPGDAADDDDDDDNAAARGAAWKNTSSTGWSGTAPARGSSLTPAGGATDTPTPASISASSFGWSVHRQVGPAFCVPPNPELMAYWDRVEDRLFKIHHCRDIHGRRRDLALFAPELDPHLLARMKAAGLTLDDITNTTSGDLPPYRFSYLIEKAKSFASTLQSFGSALLSALEKKDAEELNRLRLVHEQNILKLSTQIKRWEVDSADQAIETAKLQREAAEFRKEHYATLLSNGLSPWEVLESAGRHTASIIRGGGIPLWCAAAAAGIVPDVGSPFAMKFGGTEVSRTFAYYFAITDTTATVAENMAASTGLEVTFDRRREDWTFQRDLADHEVNQLDTQIQAAEIRKLIASRALEAHEKQIEQSEEIHDFYATKFTNHGLYTWMSRQLQKTYRQAYTNVLSVARLCQAAFQYERDDEPALAIGVDAWDGSHLGLLACDKLLLELQQMERRFIETNYRLLEIEQSFPLTQLNPAALLALRETGECTIDIPELFFDLAYPGHYRRRIKAARLTIPCITGPYTNVGATLTLTKSQVRRRHKLDAPLERVPLKRTISIATSKAQNDAGVFELTFHDERFMPFEGAGAISTWKLELPKTFRPFDYQTISDVILTLNYTALANEQLRRRVESRNQEAESSVLKYIAQNPLARIFSLRQEFPVAFRALLNSPPGTPVTFEIKDWHFPAFATAGGRRIAVKEAKLAIKWRSGTTLGDLRLTVDGEQVDGFAKDDMLAGLPSQRLRGAFGARVMSEHTLSMTAASAVDGALEDVFLCVTYQVTAS